MAKTDNDSNRGGARRGLHACSVASEVGASFPGGTWFVDLTAARTASEVLRLVSEVLALPRGASEGIGELGEALRTLGRTLIVLDNFEHLVHLAASLLNPWRRAAPAVPFKVMGAPGRPAALNRMLPWTYSPSRTWTVSPGEVAEYIARMMVSNGPPTHPGVVVVGQAPLFELEAPWTDVPTYQSPACAVAGEPATRTGSAATARAAVMKEERFGCMVSPDVGCPSNLRLGSVQLCSKVCD
jgi:hypothetical protein